MFLQLMQPNLLEMHRKRQQYVRLPELKTISRLSFIMFLNYAKYFGLWSFSIRYKIYKV